MNKLRLLLLGGTLIWLATAPAARADGESGDLPFVQGRALAELGTLIPLQHTIQFGSNGSTFDYVEEGGQDVWFPTGRLQAEIEFGPGHTVTFLYQPIDIRTSVYLRRDIVVDEATFPQGSGLDTRYGFDYYRIGYHYDFFPDDPQYEVSIGAALQIRDAVIDFTSSDGAIRRTNSDVGPVPLLRFRGEYGFDFGMWLALEADGFYAPIKYLNGGKSDVEGAILDLSARIGYAIHPAFDLFLNLRYVGGGAEGTSQNDPPPGDGFTANWLHLLGLTLGARLHIHNLL